MGYYLRDKVSNADFAVVPMFFKDLESAVRRNELDFVLKIKEEGNEIYEYYHSEQLQRYPWKDCMLAEGEWFSVIYFKAFLST